MAYVNLGQVVYPIGSVYISYTSTSPASLFGGNWAAITGHFPYFNNGISTGGSNSISHNHVYGFGAVDVWEATAKWQLYNNGEWSNLRNDSNKQETISTSCNSGLTQGLATTNASVFRQTAFTTNTSINNMPAYQTFYAWRRTS